MIFIFQHVGEIVPSLPLTRLVTDVFDDGNSSPVSVCNNVSPGQRFSNILRQGLKVSISGKEMVVALCSHENDFFGIVMHYWFFSIILIIL